MGLRREPSEASHRSTCSDSPSAHVLLRPMVQLRHAFRFRLPRLSWPPWWPAASSVGIAAPPVTAWRNAAAQARWPLSWRPFQIDLAVRLSPAEVVDDHPARAARDLDPLLARRRRHAPVGDRGQRPVGEPQRHHRVVARLAAARPARTASSIGDPISACAVSTKWQTSPSSRPPCRRSWYQCPSGTGPAATRYTSSFGPLTSASTFRAASTAGDQRRLKPTASCRPEPCQARRDLVQLVQGQRERLLAPHVPPAFRARTASSACVSCGVAITTTSVSGSSMTRNAARHRLGEAVPLGRPPRR